MAVGHDDNRGGGKVGEYVDVHVLGGIEAAENQAYHTGNDEQPVVNRKANDVVYHNVPSSLVVMTGMWVYTARSHL